MGKRQTNVTRRDFMRGTVGAAIGVSVARGAAGASTRAARAAASSWCGTSRRSTPATR